MFCLLEKQFEMQYVIMIMMSLSFKTAFIFRGESNHARHDSVGTTTVLYVVDCF